MGGMCRSMGISVIVASNPRNPTGQVIEGEELEKLVQLGREGTTLVWVPSSRYAFWIWRPPAMAEQPAGQLVRDRWCTAWTSSIRGTSTMRSFKARASQLPPTLTTSIKSM